MLYARKVLKPWPGTKPHALEPLYICPPSASRDEFFSLRGVSALSEQQFALLCAGLVGLEQASKLKVSSCSASAAMSKQVDEPNRSSEGIGSLANSWIV